MAKEAKDPSIAVRRAPSIRPWGLPDVDSMLGRMLDDSWFRQFARPWLGFRPGVSVEAPAVDMYEDKDGLIVKAEIPGLTKDEIDVSVMGSTLTIKGEKKKEEEIKEDDYYRCERSFGAFSRIIELPVEVKTSDTKATFKNGVLEIRLPKTEEAKNNVVHVKVA